MAVDVEQACFEVGPCGGYKFYYSANTIVRNKCSAYYCDKRLQRGPVGPQGPPGRPGPPGAPGGIDPTYALSLLDCFNSVFDSGNDSVVDVTVNSPIFDINTPKTSWFTVTTDTPLPGTFPGWSLNNLTDISLGTQFSTEFVSIFDPNFPTLFTNYLAGCGSPDVPHTDYLEGIAYLINEAQALEALGVVYSDIQIAIWTLLFYTGASPGTSPFVNETILDSLTFVVGPVNSTYISEMIQLAVTIQEDYNADPNILDVLTSYLVPLVSFAPTCMQVFATAVNFVTTPINCGGTQVIEFSSGQLNVADPTFRVDVDGNIMVAPPSMVLGNGINNPIITGDSYEYTAASILFQQDGVIQNIRSNVDFQIGDATSINTGGTVIVTFTVYYRQGNTSQDGNFYVANPYNQTNLATTSFIGLPTGNALTDNTSYTSSGTNTTLVQKVKAGDSIAIRADFDSNGTPYESVTTMALSFACDYIQESVL